MGWRYVEMAPNGRLVIPADIRRRPGVEKGERFHVEIDGGTISSICPVS